MRRPEWPRWAGARVRRLLVAYLRRRSGRPFVGDALRIQCVPVAGLFQIDARPRSLRALGFVTLGGRFMNNPHDILDDRIDPVTRGFLGLTVRCARLHDHKLAPLPAADSYALYGLFPRSQAPADGLRQGRRASTPAAKSGGTSARARRRFQDSNKSSEPIALTPPGPPG